MEAEVFLEGLRTAIRKDPALRGARCVEVVLYQGVWALWSHRVAHALHRARIPFLPRLLSQLARLLTGIEIHPGATIGHRLFIDHGAGVVIGETATIGDDVVLYHGVTLGSLGWRGGVDGTKRHPSLGNGVTVCVGASVLGPVDIGDGVVIGAHAVVASDVPPGMRVRSPRSVRVHTSALDEPALDYCI
jgi:serine O-acetyltransferase